MAEYSLNTENLKTEAEKLHAGDRVLLSGVVYTSRDAAHKRIFELLDGEKELPYSLDGACVYY